MDLIPRISGRYFKNSKRGFTPRYNYTASKQSGHKVPPTITLLFPSSLQLLSFHLIMFGRVEILQAHVVFNQLRVCIILIRLGFQE